MRKQAILLVFVLISAAMTCKIEQPVLSYGERPNELTFSLVTDKDCQSSPYIALINNKTKETMNIIAFTYQEYRILLGNDYYHKKAYFFKHTVAYDVPYQWAGEGTNRLGPFDFVIRNKGKGKEVNFIMISDHDLTKNGDPTNALLNRIDWSKYDGFLHGGDFAYDVQNDSGMRGDNYFNNLSTVISKVPYLVVPGNHENFDAAKMFNYRFRMPNFNSSYSSNLYANVVGQVLFFYINYDMIAKIDYSKFKDYILKAEQLFMKYKDDKDIVWRVAVSHRPMYCGESGKPDCLVNHYYFKAFDDIYRKYKVDVYLQSHEHLYERLKFINSWKFVTFPSNVTAGIVEYQDITEPLQMICGTGGSNETLIPNIPTYPIQDKQIGGIESYLDIKVNDTSFTILFKASRDQSLLDAVRLNKAAIRPVDLQDKKEPDSSSFMKSGLWLVLTVVMVLVVAAVVFYMIKNRQMQMKTYEKNPTSADTPAPPAKEYLMDEEKSRIDVSRADII